MIRKGAFSRRSCRRHMYAAGGAAAGLRLEELARLTQVRLLLYQVVFPRQYLALSLWRRNCALVLQSHFLAPGFSSRTLALEGSRQAPASSGSPMTGASTIRGFDRAEPSSGLDNRRTGAASLNAATYTSSMADSTAASSTGATSPEIPAQAVTREQESCVGACGPQTVAGAAACGAQSVATEHETSAGSSTGEQQRARIAVIGDVVSQ